MNKIEDLINLKVGKKLTPEDAINLNKYIKHIQTKYLNLLELN